jgi:hypothetical protein
MCRASTETVRTGSRESEAVGATSKRPPPAPVEAAEAALQATHQPDPLPATSCHGMCRTSTEQGAVRAKQWVQQASGPQPAPVEAAEAALQATHQPDPLPATSCHGMCRTSTEQGAVRAKQWVQQASGPQPAPVESEAVGATSGPQPAPVVAAEAALQATYPFDFMPAARCYLSHKHGASNDRKQRERSSGCNKLADLSLRPMRPPRQQHCRRRIHLIRCLPVLPAATAGVAQAWS